jgi:hypothetical protein
MASRWSKPAAIMHLMQRQLSARGLTSVAVVCTVALLVGACSGSPDDTAAYSCKAPPTGRAACTLDTDCATVEIGCYCGAQPVDGVARRYAFAAQACEDTAAGMCALGCLTEPKLVTQDGKSAGLDAMVAVHCEAATGTCKTSLP